MERLSYGLATTTKKSPVVQQQNKAIEAVERKPKKLSLRQKYGMGFGWDND